MPRAKVKPKRCKQTDLKTGRRCVRRAGPDGNCATCRKRHTVGVAPKTPKALKASVAAARTHGLYANPKYLQPEQVELLEAARGQSGTLLEELADTRMRRAWLVRWLHRIETGEESGFEDDSMEMERTGATIPTDSQGNPIAGAQPTGGTLKTKRVQIRTSRANLYAMLDRYTARIESLERTLAELGKGDPIGDPEKKAQILRGLFEAMVLSSGVLGGQDLTQARIVRGPDLDRPLAGEEPGGEG